MPIQAYQPLKPNGGEIRLVALQPAKSPSAPIHCELQCVCLSENPKYEALSYTWGAEEPNETITLNGSDFRARQNACAALRRLRSTKIVRKLWIGAISICQDDKREQGEQVSQMDEIYKKAEQVIIWLGECGKSGNIAMKSLATHNFSISNNLSVRRSQKKHQVYRGHRKMFAALRAGESEKGLLDGEIGEVADLLDRVWWRRVWIVQEVVLAKKAILMCGPDQVPWDAVKKRLRAEGVYGLQSEPSGHLHMVDGFIAKEGFQFPDKEYRILDELRTTWEPGTWTSNIYDLLYRFRRLGCTNPADRVFAFLGLASRDTRVSITADYSISTGQVYMNTARHLITVHKSLLLLNCKRESYQTDLPYQETCIYSILDQGRFVDPDALVVDVPGQKPRSGWARLPEGWERRIENGVMKFHDHKTNLSYDDSPLKSQAPVLFQRAGQIRKLPPCWQKTWDNLGNVDFLYKPNRAQIVQDPASDLSNLPSWVPNWASFSGRDPEPLPDMTSPDTCFWASGKGRFVDRTTVEDPDSKLLRVNGILFDGIKTLGPPWFPEPQNMPISRSGVGELKEWEDIALRPVENCPYEQRGGRKNAFWRTHIGDYVGERSVSEEGKVYFDAWCDHVGWTPESSEVTPTWHLSSRRQAEIPTEYIALAKMNAIVFVGKQLQDKINNNPDFGLTDVAGVVKDAFAGAMPSVNEKRAKEYISIRDRIYRASVNRAMFIISKGYIGLVPWNAKADDLVCVLLGGCTPFLLRPIPGSKRFTLVGEAYVYGIMAGELFGQERRHACLRSFEIE
jgi:hypothetical protein